MKIFDSHCHLDDNTYDRDLDMPSWSVRPMPVSYG